MFPKIDSLLYLLLGLKGCVDICRTAFLTSVTYKERFQIFAIPTSCYLETPVRNKDP